MRGIRPRMSRLLGPAFVAVCGLLVLFIVVDLFVPPWRSELPLAELEVPPSSRSLPAIPAEPGAAAGRSVLLVTLDTVRPDRLGYHGNSNVDTPALARLAREGVIFSQAVATAPSTLPSHASILTGLYPQRHGARANGSSRLGDGVETLATRLSQQGYDTAAFVSAFVLDEQFGLSRGFAAYDDDVKQSGAEFGYPERRADLTADRAIRWLERSRSTPFFLWVHFFDPHALYQPPAEFARYPLAYDGELAFTDSQLARLVGAARTAAAGELLIAVTADHGEAFGDQGEQTHSILLQESTLRIPLILHAPGAIAGGVVVPTRVSQIDIMPTLLSLLGEPIPPELDGVDLTLAPDPGRVLMAASVEGQLSFGWAPLSALYQGGWKLVEGPNPELYDLASDPLAREDQSARRPEDVARLQAALRALRPAASAPVAQTHALSREDAQRLDALGYARSTSLGEAPRDRGLDPVRRMPLLAHVDSLAALTGEEIHLATRLSALREGIWLPADGEDGIEMIEEIAEEHPDFAPTELYLADLYRSRGREAEASAAEQRFRALVRGDALE